VLTIATTTVTATVTLGNEATVVLTYMWLLKKLKEMLDKIYLLQMS